MATPDVISAQPVEAELLNRIGIARSVLAHRFDQQDPDVIALDRALSGWTLAELVAGEVH